MSLVLDASMAIAWLFEDEATRATREVMRLVAEDGAVVPSLWRLEVANVLHNAMRRQRCGQDYVDESLQRLALFPLTVDEQTDAHAWSNTLKLARSDSLTLYDAAYLELALRRSLALASCDDALVQAAKSYGVRVLTN